MVIGIIFQLASEVIEVRIDKEVVLFRTQGASFVTIDSLRLSYAGVCREHPDLELAKDWRQQAISRFKDKIKQMKTEDERVEYVIKDLEKFGYKAIAKQKQGHRVEKL